MIILKVTTVLWLVLGTVALWVPISLFLNIYSARFKPGDLKKWKDRRRKTFFEWLCERNRIRARKMSDSDRKDSLAKVSLSPHSPCVKILVRPR